MDHKTQRINPKFIQLCRIRLKAVEAGLDVAETGYRNFWQVNSDLECLASWVHDIPELKSRVEELGERYARIVFSKAPQLPGKYFPVDQIKPSRKSGHAPPPISDAEAKQMIAKLYLEDRMSFDVGEVGGMPLRVGGREFVADFLSVGLNARPGRSRNRKLQSLLFAVLAIEARDELTTHRIRQLAFQFGESFDEDHQRLMLRFTLARRSLIKEGILIRTGRSSWRLDGGRDVLIRDAMTLLCEIEQCGAEERAMNWDPSENKDRRTD